MSRLRKPNIRNKRKKLVSKLKIRNELIESINMPFELWDNVPQEMVINKTHEGKRVWLAGDTKTKYTLNKFGFKECTIDDVSKGIQRYVFTTQLVLHESEITIDDKEMKEYNKIQKAKEQMYLNKKTYRRVTYTYALNQGIIDKFGNIL